MTTPDIDRGVANLLEACAGAAAGQRLLIVEEDDPAAFYERGLGAEIARRADARGLAVERVAVPFRPEADSLPETLSGSVAAYDHVLFLARLGDQLRFTAMPKGARPIVSYVLDAGMLASSLGTGCYRSFTALKQALDRLFASAGTVRVTCPLGTDYAGRVKPMAEPAAGDVTVKRFPMSVFSPIDAATFSGRVAVAHCLAGTGSRYYEPYGVALEGTAFAHVDGNRLEGWEGPDDAVARIAEHYDRVASRFGVARDHVHSWHAGIHPGCAYPGRAMDDPERWSGSAFGNPRLLHFHTCGEHAPGEICWNIVDPTVTVDGVAIWDEGRLHPERFPEGRRILDGNVEFSALFATPRREMGL